MTAASVDDGGLQTHGLYTAGVGLVCLKVSKCLGIKLQVCMGRNFQARPGPARPGPMSSSFFRGHGPLRPIANLIKARLGPNRPG